MASLFGSMPAHLTKCSKYFFKPYISLNAEVDTYMPQHLTRIATCVRMDWTTTSSC